jgi:hypothetical protein
VNANAVSSTIPFKGYNESTARLGTLEYRTYYNTISNPGYIAASNAFSIQPKLRKPVIILDGYDPGDSRKIYDGSAGYNGDKFSILEFMSYDIDDIPKNGNEKNLVKELQDKGYDVTLVNFPNGADFIERNAMAVVALLQRENSKLSENSSTEKITLIGPSMGGLISRYALSYMEKNNIPHNTKLWVSFDSPHHGANIPLSSQANLFFLGTTAESKEAKDKFIENFLSPAARQMLIEQMENYPNPTLLTSRNSKNNNHPFRQQFLQNLTTNGVENSNGFPKQTRNIAVINGTTNGVKTNSESQTVYDITAFGALKIKGFYLINRNLATPGNEVTTFEGRFTKVVQCYIPLTGLSYSCGITIKNRSRKDININPRGSMDVVQGGTFNTVGIIKKSLDENPDVQENTVENRITVENHCFIPTISSLAFKNPNFDWNTNVSRNLICNDEIPFQSYYAPPNNQAHVKVTKEMVDWLLKEIQGMEQPPSFPVNPNALSGPQVVCNGANAVYSFDVCNVPGGATWTVSPNMQIVNSTDYSVTITGIGNGKGEITAVFKDGQKIIKTIWIGKPLISAIKNTYNPPGIINIQLRGSTDNDINLQGISNVLWEEVSDTPESCGEITSPSGFGNGISYVGFSCTTKLKITATNNCGSTTIFPSIRGGYKPGDQLRTASIENTYKIHPNPSNNIINISLKNQNEKPISNTKIIAKLYNMIGEQKSNVEIVNNTASINVSNLPKGIYVLKIDIDGNLENHQVVVE